MEAYTLLDAHRDLMRHGDPSKVRKCLRCRTASVKNGNYICGPCNRINSRVSVHALTRWDKTPKKGDEECP